MVACWSLCKLTGCICFYVRFELLLRVITFAIRGSRLCQKLLATLLQPATLSNFAIELILGIVGNRLKTISSRETSFVEPTGKKLRSLTNRPLLQTPSAIPEYPFQLTADKKCIGHCFSLLRGTSSGHFITNQDCLFYNYSKLFA